MSKTLTLQLDDETYRLFHEAAQAENRPLARFIEACTLAWIGKQQADRTADSERAQLQQAVEEAEQGIAQGRWVEHAEVAAKLERWAAGEA